LILVIVVLSVVSFLILCYEYWPLKFKIVSSPEYVQYKMCYKDFNYNIYIYIVALFKLVKL